MWIIWMIILWIAILIFGSAWIIGYQGFSMAGEAYRYGGYHEFGLIWGSLFGLIPTVGLTVAIWFIARRDKEREVEQKGVTETKSYTFFYDWLYKGEERSWRPWVHFIGFWAWYYLPLLGYMAVHSLFSTPRIRSLKEAPTGLRWQQQWPAFVWTLILVVINIIIYIIIMVINKNSEYTQHVIVNSKAELEDEQEYSQMKED